MKIYGKEKVYLHAFLTLATDKSGWSASCPGYVSPEKETLIFTEYKVGSASDMVQTM
jgi:hypothetical protein